MYFVPLIVTPILSRLFSPEAFGEWGIFSSVINIVGVGMFLGYENAIVKAGSESDSINICVLCLLLAFGIICVLGLLFLLGCFFQIRFITEFPYAELLFIYLLFYIFYIVLYNYANRRECYNTLAVSHIVSGLSQASFRIFFGIISLTFFNGLILGTTFALMINVPFLLFCLRNKLNFHFYKNINCNDIFSLAKRYKRFPIFDAPGSIMAFAAFQAPTIILVFFFSKSVIGCFSIVIQLLLMPMSFIGSAMSKVYYQQLCIVQDNIDEISKVTYKVIKTVCIISIIPLLFLAIGGDKLIALFLGNKWSTTGDVALCLALWSFPTALTEPLIPLYRTLDKQKTLLFFHTLYFIGGIGSVIIGCLISHNLYCILLTFSTICFFVKFAMFFNLSKLAKINRKNICKLIFTIWGISVFVLFVRIYYLFI